MNKEKIEKAIKEIKNKLNELELELDLVQIGAPIHTSVSIEQNSNNLEFDKLKNILNSNEWPEAVLDFQIVDQNSEEEKMDRAEGIIDILVDEELENKKFLDIGCGEGHMAKYASTQKTTISVGYDVIKSEKSKLSWETEENNLLLTTNFEKVKEKAPYDIITIYDVLDHADDPKEVLEKAKNVLADNGKIYLRCHPWCGRHGGHYYRQINKAFVHLVFTEAELEQMNYKLEEKNNKILFPILQYNQIINNASLKKIKEEVEKQELEDFFQQNELVKNRIINYYKQNNFNDNFPKFQTEMCFLDFVLGK